MLEDVVCITDKYLNSKSKNDRKKIGQFFTSKETAEFMANLSKIHNENIRILDAGAGTGILSIALLEKLNNIEKIKNIEIDLYENDENIVELLKNNIEKVRTEIPKIKKCNILNENFILYNKNNFVKKYDIIISNPPYKKIGKSADEAVIMEDVVYGQPNMYFLFMAMAERLLKDNGEMIFIIPRSWTSGAYFKKFRQSFLNKVKLTNIHLFVSRDKVFSQENVLQETMIIRAIKTQERQDSVTISQSFSNADFNNINTYNIEYDTCVQKNNDRYVYLPTNDEEIKVLQTINSFKTKLNDIGVKLKTGLTVDFRNERLIENNSSNNNVPLLSSVHFNNGVIKFPSKDNEQQYIRKDIKSLLQRNTNYLFIKRFSSKEENRRIQPAMFFKHEFKEYDYISTENHINFIASIDEDELQEEIIYGLYGLYNSTLYDKYYRILNGSTQVNATEINNIPIPDENLIKHIGECLMKKEDLSTEICDNILLEVIRNE